MRKVIRTVSYAVDYIKDTAIKGRWIAFLHLDIIAVEHVEFLLFYTFESLTGESHFPREETKPLPLFFTSQKKLVRGQND